MTRQPPKTKEQTPMTAIAQTAAEYADRYHQARDNDLLAQGAWHSEQDGRHVACALGVLGDAVNSASKCPAQIMPRWLARMVPAFFDNQPWGDAFAWGAAFVDQLKRLDGKVPFRVVHDWHANTVCELAIDVAAKLKRDPAPHVALQAMHLRALAGERITAEEWRPVLKNAYAAAYAYAYAYAYAAADIDADADADADAYANAYAYADADADAYANADAYVDDDADAYSGAVAVAYADAVAWKQLADGMVAALSRVES